jgi:hypothetical protein
MGKSGDPEPLHKFLQHREDVKREINDLLARHAAAQERVAALSREHQQLTREIDELNLQYISLAAARQEIEKRIAARSDGLQVLMPGVLGTGLADAHAQTLPDVVITAGQGAEGHGSPITTDLYASILTPYLPPHGRSGQRLKSSARPRSQQPDSAAKKTAAPTPALAAPDSPIRR